MGVAPTQIHFLDQRDGKLKYMPDAERQPIIEQLTRIIHAFNPGEVYVTHRNDRSADHEAAYAMVKTAIADSGLDIELLQYPIWILWKTLLFQDVKRLELTGARRLSSHTVLPPKFLRGFFLPYEVFFKADL